MTLFLVSALLLSIVEYANPPQYTQAQISTAPATDTTTTNSSATSCEKFPVAGVTASANGLMVLNVLDNNLNTAWSNNGLGSWIQADLGGQKAMCSLDLAWYRGDQVKYDFIISVSNDGTTFTNVFAGKSSGAAISYETYFLQAGTVGRYVRITVNGNDNNNKNNNVDSLAGIAELAVYGYSSAPSPTPTADNKNVQTGAGTPVQITLTGNDPISEDALKFSVVSLPQHGSLTQGTALNSVVYNPSIGFSGTESFTYKATDSQGVDSNIATITINVNSPSSPSKSSPAAANGENFQTASISGPSLGNMLPGDPASARDSDGRLEVFVVQSDNALYHKSETAAGTSSSWTAFSPLGGFVISQPVVAQNSDGRLEVFVIGGDHALYHKWQVTAGSSTWSGFSDLGGNFISNPAVARNSDGRLEVFVVGADRALYHNFQQSAGSSSSWSGFTNLGGSILSNPVVGQNRDGRLEVFVVGGNHALSHIFEMAPSSSNSWSVFSGLGGSSLLSDPVVASNSDGRLEVFVIGSNNQLDHIFEMAASSSNSWSVISSLGGIIISNPAVASNSDGRLEVFVMGTNKALFHKYQTAASSSNSWSVISSLGGIIISDPVVASNSDGRLEVFVIGTNNQLFHKYQTAASSSNSWSGFVSLGGNIINLIAQDKFGIKELYPSKSGGEQFTMNMQSESNDPQFDPNGSTLTKNADGTYNVQSSSVRLQIFTSTGFHENLIKTLAQECCAAAPLAQQGYMQSSNDWKNVEITGYLKPNHFTTSTTNGAAHIEYVARGARNTNDNYLVGNPPLSAQCEATTYHSNTYMTGRVKFEKDLMHTAGYTANSQDPQILNTVNMALGKWVGIKAVYYNFPNGTVKLEQWVDDSTDNINSPGNKWHKVLDFNDHGQWGGGNPNCDGTPSTIITWGGPIALFRWDNIDNMDFKDFSIREIQPP